MNCGSVPALPPNNHAVLPTALPTTAEKLACDTLPEASARTRRSKPEGMTVFAVAPARFGNMTLPPVRPIVTGPELLPAPIATVAFGSSPRRTLPATLSESPVSAVNAPVLGARLPIGVLLIAPPEIVALPLNRFGALSWLIVALLAVRAPVKLLMPVTFSAPPTVVGELVLPMVVGALPVALILVVPTSVLAPLTAKEFVVRPPLALTTPVNAAAPLAVKVVVSMPPFAFKIPLNVTVSFPVNRPEGAT